MATTTKGKNSYFIFKFVLLGILVLGGAFFIGKSDKGEIDVSEAIVNSNSNRTTQEDGTMSEPTPVPSELSKMPNGGLVPSGKKVENIPAPASEEALASTSNATSTDTNGGIDARTENSSDETSTPEAVQ